MVSINLPLGTGTTRRTPYVILAYMQVIDVVITALILNWMGGAEGNPIARQLTDLGAIGFLALLGFKLWIVHRLYKKQTGVRFISAVYGIVLANNLLFLILWLSQGI